MHVIVHIGQPKAGSTAIQAALHLQLQHLEEAGFFVATRAGEVQDLSLALTRYDWVAASPILRLKFGTMAAARDFSERRWDRLRSLVRERRPEVTLLSSEHFMSPAVAGPLLERLAQTFERVSVICYLRDPVTHYVSNIDQKIRGGDRFSELRPPVSTGRLQVFAAVRAYHDRIKSGDLVLRNFDRANLVAGDVVADYFAQVSHITGRIFTPVGTSRSSNESLCGAATAWLLTLNETYDRRGGPVDPAALELRRALVARLRWSEALKELPRLKLSDPALIAPIRRAARADLDWLNATLLQGQLPFDTALPDGAPAETPDAATLRARLRDWLLGYLTPEAAQLIAREITVDTPPPRFAPFKQVTKAADSQARARRRAARKAATETVRE